MTVCILNMITNPKCIAGTDGIDVAPGIGFRKPQIKEYSVVMPLWGKVCICFKGGSIYSIGGRNRDEN